jgi:hypothetical protein
MTTMAWALIGARPHKSRAQGRYVGAASGFQRGAFNAPNEWDGERYRRDCVAAPPRCRKRPIAVGCPAAFGRAVHEHHCWSRPISAVVLVRTPGGVQQRKFTIGELLRAGHHSSPRDAGAVLCACRKASQSPLFRMLDTSGSPASVPLLTARRASRHDFVVLLSARRNSNFALPVLQMFLCRLRWRDANRMESD